MGLGTPTKASRAAAIDALGALNRYLEALKFAPTFSIRAVTVIVEPSATAPARGLSIDVEIRSSKD